MNKLATFALAACAAAIALPAAAQQAPKPEDVIKYRKAAFVVMTKNFHSLSLMADGKAPYNAAQAAADADVLAAVYKLPFTAFAPGTDKGDTRTKPEAWTNQAKFKEATDKMEAEMPKLIAAARSGNLDTLKAAFGPTARTCKGCHDDFRKD